jgi:TonB family protein
MRLPTVFLLIFISSRAVGFLPAQDLLEVGAKDIQQHIDHKAFLTYPPMAKAAGIQGTVVFDLNIGANGRIASMKVLSGPPELQQAATNCLKQWTFHPFEKNGEPSAAHGQYSLIFLLGGSGSPPKAVSTASHEPEMGLPAKVAVVNVKAETTVSGVSPEIEKQFQDADDQCKNGVMGKDFTDRVAASCRNAAEIADKLPMEGNYITKRSAFVYAATAFGNIGSFEEGLVWASRAVDLVNLGHDSDAGCSAAYSTKGTLEGLLRDLTASDLDLTKSEEFSHKVLASAMRSSPDLRPTYAPLARDLKFHAQVLRALHRDEEAEKRLAEAEGLK